MPLSSDGPIENYDKLRNKTAVFIGGGGLSKQSHYLAARTWGMTVIVIVSPNDTLDPICADRIIAFSELDIHVDDIKHAHSIVKLLYDSGIDADCVLTIWEDCGPLAAEIARLLSLNGLPSNAAFIAKSKLLTQMTLTNSNDPTVNTLAVKTVSANTLDELRLALEQVPPPAVLKLEHGSSAAGVARVSSVDEAIVYWCSIIDSLRSESDCPGVGLGYGTKVVVSELLVGTEHDVDLVLWQGDTIASFVTDNGLTRIPRYAESTALMPSIMPKQAQKQFIAAAVRACRAIGITTGVVNVELIVSPSGLKIIDVNARMGGFYIRDWIKRIWNYDILVAALYCSLDERPFSPSQSKGWIAGAMILPSAHLKWIQVASNAQLLFNDAGPNEEIISLFDEHARPMALVDEPYANIGVLRDHPEVALAALVALWDKWGLAAVDPTFPSFLPQSTPAPSNY